MAGRGDWTGVRVFTIGHSTRTIDELVDILRSVGVTVLADIRTIPRSRHNPQFAADALGPSLRARGLRYVPIPALGGLRHARAGSPNDAWRNQSLRGYADHMQSAEFAGGLAELRALAAKGTLALMCAEAVPWRCHRSLVADALTARGAEVAHLMGPGQARPHRLTPFAVVDGPRVTYPAEPPDRLAGVVAPFHLEATVRVLQRRPANLVDVWEDGRYRRVRPVPGGLALGEIENVGSIDAPDLRLHLLAGPDEEASRAAFTQAARRVLRFELDPAPIEARAEAEIRLRPTARALRGMRPPRFDDLFEAFANVVPFQQVSLDAGVAIVRRLVERFGATLPWAGRTYHAFPVADDVAGARLETLRACGLSGQKATSLRAIARLIADGALHEDPLASMPTPEALDLLRELPGIGPWSAALVLLRGLGRLDVFPPGDVGVAKGLGALLRLRAGATLGPLERRFGEFRGQIYFYALGSSLLARGLIHPAPSAESHARESPDAAGAGA